LLKGSFLPIALASGKRRSNKMITVGPNVRQEQTCGNAGNGSRQKFTSLHECLQYGFAATMAIMNARVATR
jgi:hypothetical protein